MDVKTSAWARGWSWAPLAAAMSVAALVVGCGGGGSSGAVGASAYTAGPVRGFGSELVGPAASVDTANSSLVMLDQTVDVKPETVFDDSLTGGLAALAGKVVEAHAQPDVATGHHVATRVEAKASGDSERGVELHGTISDVDAAAKTFMLRGLKVSFAGTVSYERGTEAQLVAGVQVEAKGLLSADRTTMAASLIRFED